MSELVGKTVQFRRTFGFLGMHGSNPWHPTATSQSTDDDDDENDDEFCGEAYDHRFDVIDERDGMRTYVCRECGAEIQEEDDEGTS